MAASADREESPAKKPLFTLLTEDQIEQLIVGHVGKDSQNTKDVINYATNILKSYCDCEKVDTTVDSLSCLSREELCIFLRTFYAGVRKMNGDLYRSKSMLTIRYGLQRYFQCLSGVDIVANEQFQPANDVFSAMLVKLKAEGKGVVQHKNPISKKDMEKIMSSSVMDQATPIGLQNKVFVDIGMHFCNRGRENLRGMTKSHFMIQTDSKSNGLKYVSIARDMQTKIKNHHARQGDLGDGEASQRGRMYENSASSTCPVKSFELYLQRLNANCDMFWQRPKRKLKSGETDWYDNACLGKNTLGDKMKIISKEAQCSKVYTNHCLRATDANGFEERHIMGNDKDEDKLEESSDETRKETAYHETNDEDEDKLEESSDETKKETAHHETNDEDEDKLEESSDETRKETAHHETDVRKSKRLKKDICAALGCPHRKNKNSCILHTFPKDPELIKKWIEASRCNVNKDGKTKVKNFSSQNLKICGCHFVQKPHPKSANPRLRNIVPSLFAHTSAGLKTTSKSPRLREKKPTPSQNSVHPDLYDRMKDVLSKEAYNLVDSCNPVFWKDYHQLQEDVTSLKATCNSFQLLSLKNIKDDDYVFETYTGLPNYATFEALSGYLELNARSLQRSRAGIAFGELQIKETSGVKKQTLTTKDQLFLFLVGIRTGSSSRDLAIRFDISEQLFNIIISSWAVFLSETLDEFYSTASAATPPLGKNNSEDAKINVAVDYTALFSQSPALLTTRKDEASGNGNRRLIAVGFSSTGAVMSVLSTLRGHAFAKVATNKTKDIVPAQTVSREPAVRANGAKIETNLPKPVSMHVVSMDLSKSDMTLMSTNEVFHVERALNKIKQFRYLQQQVQPALIDTYEQVFKACAFLTNFQNASSVVVP